MKRSAFTLIELLVLAAFLAMMATVLAPFLVAAGRVRKFASARS